MSQVRDVNHFIKSRQQDWSRLQALMGGGKRRLSAAEVRELGGLYRAVTSDLALARRDFPNEKVTTFLNRLLTQTHSYIYQEDVSDYNALFRYFWWTVPRAFQQVGKFTFVAFLMFIIPAILSYSLALRNPITIADALGLQAQQEILADQDTWTNIPPNERPGASAFIMSNNIRVAILAFGGGVVFGLFTTWVLFYNGIQIGAVMGLAAHYGQGGVLLDFVFAHGVIELSVIFMAGGAGLALGWALLNPGIYTRRDALGIAAREVVPLIVISIPLLIVAGLIEGFISPSSLPFSQKVFVGLFSGAQMYTYLLLLGRRSQTPKAAMSPSSKRRFSSLPGWRS